MKSFAGAAVSDLERRDLDVDGERIANEGPVSGAKFAFGAKKLVDDCWIGSSRTMILSGLDGRRTAGVSDRPAKLKKITQRLVRIMNETAAPFGNVEVRGYRKTKHEGVGTSRMLEVGVERDETRGKRGTQREKTRTMGGRRAGWRARKS